MFVLLLGEVAAHAHPMGNFSINHYARIEVNDGSMRLLYLIDRAEIPTYQELQDSGLNATENDTALSAYLRRQAGELQKGLMLEVDGRPLRLVAVSQSALFPPGAGGLPTMKIGLLYEAKIPGSGRVRLHYADNNFPGHAGWKEIVVRGGKGVRFAGNVNSTDRSAELSNYPTNLLNSPPQDLEASVEFELTTVVIKPAVGAVASAAVSVESPKVAEPTTATVSVSPPALQPNRQATPRNRFTELMTRPHLGFWFLLTAAFIAAGLGALHALEPGHGKTIVAAYLVGSRGTAKHAVMLGVLVTASHTAGVYLLGAVVLYLSAYVVPERIYPWLSVVSGLTIAVLACYMLLRAYTGEDPAHDEQSGGHRHWGAPGKLGGVEERGVSLRQMLALGITGGIIPCPAALVVLLSAVALHRVALGLYLIVAFSVGLASVLIAIGLLMVRAQRWLARFSGEGTWARRWLPMISSSVMLIAGLAIAATAFGGSTPLVDLRGMVHNRVASFAAIVLLGLFLGIRHSTDPDHVVAVSTIVARGRSVKQGALIGMLWGFGHTITIFLVGAAIILFGLSIPPRLGLSMEFSVACMLVLLGVLNLTGVLPKLTRRLTPRSWLDTNAPDTKPLSTAARVKQLGWFHVLRPLFIGLVHGLAGSAAVALLVLSMIRNPVWAVGYLLVFGFGTVLGMMLMTTVMAVPVALTGKGVTGWLTMASGVVSVCFGLFLAYQIGFVDGLFRATAHWTPQ